MIILTPFDPLSHSICILWCWQFQLTLKWWTLADNQICPNQKFIIPKSAETWKHFPTLPHCLSQSWKHVFKGYFFKDLKNRLLKKYKTMKILSTFWGEMTIDNIVKYLWTVKIRWHIFLYISRLIKEAILDMLANIIFSELYSYTRILGPIWCLNLSRL